MKVQEQTLYFKDGSSDKIYQADIEEVTLDQYTVNFAYGRRGAALKSGTKTNTPVGKQEAEKLFNELIKSKTSKGYTPGEAGKPFQSTSKESQVTGLVPQLLNTISEQEVQKLLVNPEFIMQEKHDGRRTILKTENGNVTGANKKGLSIAVTLELEKEAQVFGNTTLDGEWMGSTYEVFEILEANGKNLRELPYSQRLEILEATVPENGKIIRRVKTAKTTKEKISLFKQLQAENREGVVFKNLNAAMHPGRPASGGSQLKFKFYAENSFIVAKINQARSVGLQVLEKGLPIDVGNVTIPVNMEIPKIGDILEVTYLYAYPGGSIYQPKNPKVRTDADASDCQLQKLKFKPSTSDDE